MASRSVLTGVLSFAMIMLAGRSLAADPVAELNSLTAEHFRDTATIKDDPLDTVATITTLRGFQERHGLLGIVWDDTFIRIFIEKKSGKRTFQIYSSLPYEGPNWRFYQSVNYETLTGPESAMLTVISHDLGGCSGRGSCSYSESVGFDVPEELLRSYANGANPGASNRWLFKINAKDGTEYRGGLTLTEIRGALMALDRYKAREAAGDKSLIFIPAGPFGASTGNLHPMWGLPGGALIVGVSRGSIAERAGLKWTDGIIEWDGAKISNQADLEVALLKTSAGQRVRLKVLRVRKVLDLEAQF